MSGPRCSYYGSNHNHKNHLKSHTNHKSQNYKKINGSSKALWLPWHACPVLPVSKPLQIIWMVCPVNNSGIPGNGTNSGTGNSQPPLIANPPSQPLIIPSHVANALLLTRWATFCQLLSDLQGTLWCTNTDLILFNMSYWLESVSKHTQFKLLCIMSCIFISSQFCLIYNKEHLWCTNTDLILFNIILIWISIGTCT